MSIANKFFVAVIGTLTCFATQPVFGGSYHHISGLAVTFQRQARDLEHEFGAHFRHTSEYPHMRSDARELLRLATHIHELAHREIASHHFHQDLTEADEAVHHLKRLVDQVARCRTYGHIHGYVGHVYHLLRRMESTIHHLRSDVKQLVGFHHGAHRGHAEHLGHRGVRPGIGYGNHVPIHRGTPRSTSPYLGKSSGVSLGHDGWRIRIGF